MSHHTTKGRWMKSSLYSSSSWRRSDMLVIKVLMVILFIIMMVPWTPGSWPMICCHTSGPTLDVNINTHYWKMKHKTQQFILCILIFQDDKFFIEYYKIRSRIARHVCTFFFYGLYYSFNFFQIWDSNRIFFWQEEEVYFTEITVKMIIWIPKRFFFFGHL